MSFGLTSTFVVNEGQPAAWVSLLADFPPNKINGRILYATDTLEIYIDIVPSVGPAQRRQLTSKATEVDNGLSLIENSGIPDILVLGGALIQSTDIQTNGNAMTLDNVGIATVEITSGVPVPNSTILLTNKSDGMQYKILAEQL